LPGIRQPEEMIDDKKKLKINDQRFVIFDLNEIRTVF
jgi:hypothetical protein